MPFSDVLSWAALAIGLVAAGLGVRAATIQVRDSMDDFMADLRHQGRWASWAAVAAALSAVLQVADKLLG